MARIAGRFPAFPLPIAGNGLHFIPKLTRSFFIRQEENPSPVSNFTTNRFFEGVFSMSEILVLEGTVVHGQALGRRFGFPTANLSLPDGQPLPEAGVYASVAVPEDGARYPAVTNVGARPTVDDSGRATVETNLMDFSGDLYGQRLRVELHQKLRGVHRFESMDALKAQIDRDREAARALLGNVKSAE